MKSEYIVYDECGNYYAGKITYKGNETVRKPFARRGDDGIAAFLGNGFVIPKAGYTEILWTGCESGAERLSRSRAFRLAASLTRQSGMCPRICHAKKYTRAA